MSGRASPPRWPRRFRRQPMERVATALVVVGVVMMLQPFTMFLYSRSFVVTLAGTMLFLIVSKFPE